LEARSTIAAAGQSSSLLQLATSSFHTGTASASSAQALSGILAKEIKHEKTVYEKDELVARGAPAPFILHSTMGDTAGGGGSAVK
jgi:hypothetical protein